MKNIHVLPTDKPSRLFIYDGKLGFAKGFQYGSNVISNQNIYITSDEEIKEDDWFLCLDNGKCNDSIYKANEAWLNMEEKQPSYCKKIILTTDQDLDGVQAIDDEFLEWFVKNPSCEEVEINLIKDSEDHPEIEGGYREEWEYYDIIILKEEQKKILVDMMQDDEELGLYDEPKQEDEFCYYSGLPSPAAYSKEEPNMISDWLEQNRNPEIDKQVERELEYLSRQEIKLEEVFNDEKKENIKKFIDEINNPSQPNQALKDAAGRYSETLEEVAENYAENEIRDRGNSNDKLICSIDFIEGAKWQMERSYSEEEIMEMFHNLSMHLPLHYEFLVKEQFKKK